MHMYTVPVKQVMRNLLW